MWNQWHNVKEQSFNVTRSGVLFSRAHTHTPSHTHFLSLTHTKNHKIISLLLSYINGKLLLQIIREKSLRLQGMWFFSLYSLTRIRTHTLTLTHPISLSHTHTFMHNLMRNPQLNVKEEGIKLQGLGCVSRAMSKLMRS